MGVGGRLLKQLRRGGAGRDWTTAIMFFAASCASAQAGEDVGVSGGDVLDPGELAMGARLVFSRGASASDALLW